MTATAGGTLERSNTRVLLALLSLLLTALYTPLGCTCPTAGDRLLLGSTVLLLFSWW